MYRSAALVHTYTLARSIYRQSGKTRAQLTANAECDRVVLVDFNARAFVNGKAATCKFTADFFRGGVGERNSGRAYF